MALQNILSELSTLIEKLEIIQLTTLFHILTISSRLSEIEIRNTDGCIGKFS